METGYSIGQLAKAAGVPVKTLRYYSNIGLLEPAAITEAKYRRYRDRDVVKVALIRSLRSLGFSLDVIREVMRNRQTARDVVQLQLAGAREPTTQHPTSDRGVARGKRAEH
jgi:DNA-binding transcriptional MerR regulator